MSFGRQHAEMLGKGDEVGISRQEQKRDLEKNWCSDSGHGGDGQELVMLR